MKEPESILAMVETFKKLFIKIKEEESSTILYPYSTSSSAAPISEVTHLPNTYTKMKRYIPGFKPPLKGFDLMYSQLFIGTSSAFDDWKPIFLEWTRNNGHGLYLKFVQDELTTPVGYFLYTH